MSKVLMVQGTMSSAGKSLLVAALCRIFYQDGFSVCPFKSQNMSLNSFITDQGLEMGRAQVIQAEAAKIPPMCEMNPILLKPSSDMSSQVIVNGKPLAQMKAREYFAWKTNLWPQILDSYNTLSSMYDIVVVEGAGSPVEINLRENDIVNMGLALKLNAPVLLVGDIDRGGVFAQFVGTEKLLEESERALLKGFVINKMRGDPSLLENGFPLLKKYTDVPVVGTISFMNIHLDDEDSVSSRLSKTNRDLENQKDTLHIAVVKLPHLSNFSDFTAFEDFDNCVVQYATEADMLDGVDCIIIPGTKNTVSDLKYLWTSGFAQKICALNKKSVPVVGICGGFQMLGVSVDDADGFDSGVKNSFEKGLSLLPVQTKFSSEKTCSRVKLTVKEHDGFFAELSLCKSDGYEIHQGVTELCGSGGSYFSELTDIVKMKNKCDGCIRDNVFGTYAHGLFDNMDFTKKFLNILANKKGIRELSSTHKSYASWKNEQYDFLADTVRKNLDMNFVYKIMEEQYGKR